MKRKTVLLVRSPPSGQQRHNYAKKTLFETPSNEELLSFQAIQKALSTPSFLFHFNNKEQLFIDLDTSKEARVGVIVYYIKGDLIDYYLKRSQIRPILFLSRLLKDTKTRYQLIELELVGIIQVLSKVRYIAELAPKTIIYTDHGSALPITKQTTLTTSSTVRLNLRVVRVSEYIQRFRNIEFRYKLRAQYIVPNVLSRLQLITSETYYLEGELDALQAYIYTVTTLVEMSPELKARLLDGYAIDLKQAKIAEVLENNENTSEDAAKLLFIRRDDGLFQRIEDSITDYIYTPQRLYVPNNCVQEFLDITYSGGHVGRDKCHEIIARQWFILGLDRKLREYIRHCPKCQLYQTRRY